MQRLQKISILITIILLLGACQSKYSTKHYGKMRVLHYTDYSIHFYLADKDIKIKTDNVVMYTYFQGDRIVQTQGEYDGRLLNGTYKSLYTSKILKEKGTYKNGVKDGEWKRWNVGGKLVEVSHWKSGKLHGPFTTYKRGVEISTLMYKKNELVINKKDNKPIKDKTKEDKNSREKSTEESKKTVKKDKDALKTSEKQNNN